MKRKLILFFEWFFRRLSMLGAVVSIIMLFVYMLHMTNLCDEIVVSDPLHNVEIFGVCAAVWTLLENKKHRRIQNAIGLINELDTNSYFRNVKNFSRKIGKVRSQYQMSEKQLINLLYNQTVNKKVKSHLQNNNIRYDKKSIDKYEEYLISLFNYWVRVYSSVHDLIADEDYVLSHLGSIFNQEYARFKPWLQRNWKSLDVFEQLSIYIEKNNKGTWYNRIEKWWNF